MARILLHRDFMAALRALPVSSQKKLDDFIDRFQRNPHDGSIQLHKLSDRMTDPRVRGARLDLKYRIIVVAPEKGDTYLLAYVDTHDEAYDWAENKRFEIHPETGTLQIYSTRNLETRSVEKPEVSARPQTPPAGLFARFDDEDIFRAGVPRALIPAVKAVETEDALTGLLAYLPDDCTGVLIDMAGGMSVDDALAGFMARPAVEAPPVLDSFDELREQPDIIRADDPEFLRQILDQKIEDWRVFLHPEQRALVEASAPGQLVINGAAGTGKTVVLLHRAAFLRARFPQDRIIFLTYSGTLALELRAQLRTLLGSDARFVEIVSIYHMARRICARIRPGVEVINESHPRWAEVWKNAFERHKISLGMSDADLRAEYLSVIEVNGIATRDEYWQLPRRGLPRLERERRSEVWKFVSDFRSTLAEGDFLSTEESLRMARAFFETHSSERYEHVIADEIQDMAVEGLKFIRCLWNDSHPRASFTIAGDGHQRLYVGGVPLSRAGIETRGRRSRRLKLNYRTTEEIRSFAHELLTGQQVDDLNGGVTTTLGDRSLFHGPRPAFAEVADIAAEGTAIATFVNDLLASGYPDRSICITSSDEQRLHELRLLMEKKDIPCLELTRQTEDNPDKPGVRIAGVRRIKGLEFRAVVFACGSGRPVITRMKDAAPLERGEVYVACTRAREKLFITIPSGMKGA